MNFLICAAIAGIGVAHGEPSTAGAALPAPATLTETGERYVLNRELGDFYDTAWVLTQGKEGTPKVVDLNTLASTLATYDVVFFGEVHRHPGVHLQQQRLLRALHARYPKVIVSLEQFERDVQPVIDDYLAGKIGETTLIDKGRAWDNYRTSYRPLVQFAKVNKLPVIAAEAPVWAISCIGQAGPEVLEKFTAEERSWVAKDLHIGPGPYRDKYMKFQSGTATHGGGSAQTPQALLRAERSFAGQVARDDSMAESIFLATKKYPGYKVLHLNGHFHSAGFLGTVEQLKVRNPALKIAVIQPIEVKNATSPSFTKTDQLEGTALQLVYPSPEDFSEGEDQSEWVKKIISKRTANPCKYAAPPLPAAAAASSAPTLPASSPSKL